jgi:hypothetical protein
MPAIPVFPVSSVLAVLFFGPILATGQSEAGLFELLPPISGCVSKVSPIQHAGKGFSQSASYEREKSSEELAEEAQPKNPERLTIRREPNPWDPPLNYCGRISVGVDLPKLKEPKRIIYLGGVTIRTRILMRNMEAYLITSPCDTIPCPDDAITHLEIKFSKGRTIWISLNRRFGDGVAFSRSIDYKRLNDAIDAYLKQTPRSKLE